MANWNLSGPNFSYHLCGGIVPLSPHAWINKKTFQNHCQYCTKMSISILEKSLEGFAKNMWYMTDVHVFSRPKSVHVERTEEMAPWARGLAVPSMRDCVWIPSNHVEVRQGCAHYKPGVSGWRQRNHWNFPARYFRQSVIFRFPERPCFKGIRQRAIEDSWFSSLASTHAPTCICTYMYMCIHGLFLKNDS